MVPAAIPKDEAERLADLHDTGLLDSEEEEDFDGLVRLTAAICNVPISLISLIDASRQWIKSKVGIDVCETPRQVSFCAHTILQNDLFVVPDAQKDNRFSDNPFVAGDPHIRFYAGMPLTTSSGHNLGTLCVIDFHPRNLSAEQTDALKLLSRQVLAQIELRRKTHQLEHEIQEKLRYQQELITANNRLEELATTDFLTRLKTNRVFREVLEHEIETSRRYGYPLSLLMIDVDQFKKLNDTHGHLAGDAVLRGIASVILSTVRAPDLAARYGGDEFVVLLPSTGIVNADKLGSRIHDMVAASEFENYRATVSIGVAAFTKSMRGSNELIEMADEALYRAKREGGNRVS